MSRAGALNGVRRRGICVKESCLLMLGAGPPLQISAKRHASHLSSAITSCSIIISSHFQPYRRVRPHSCYATRNQQQRVLLLDSESRNGRFAMKHFPSFVHASSLKQQGPRPKGKFKDPFNLSSTREPMRSAYLQSFKSPLYESREFSGNYPSLVNQLHTAFEPPFPSASLDSSKRTPHTREEEEQSSPISKVVVTGNALTNCLDGWSTPAWMKARINLTPQGRSQPGASYGSRDRSRDPAQGNASKHRHSSSHSMSCALAILKNRLQRGMTVDIRMYVDLLRRCLKQKDVSKVKHIHACIVQSGMDKNIFVASSLVNVYSQCGEMGDARRVFDQLEEKSIVAWTMMIAGYAKHQRAESAFEIFNQMRHEGWRPDEITYLSILKACASPRALKWGREIHACIRDAGFESDVRVGTALVKMYASCGCISEATIVFRRLTTRNVMTWTAMIGGLAQHGHGHEAYRMFLHMKREGYEPDVVTWNVVIGGLSQNGCKREAYRLLVQMRKEGFEPDAYTYASILNASASSGPLDWVKEVHGQAREAGVDSDLRVGTALVHMYAVSGSIEDARLTFDRMEKRDVVTWTTMIDGLAHHGCGPEALALFRQMNAGRVKPNGTTFVAVLSACCHGGLVDDGRRLFTAMKHDYGIEPDIVHYTCMVDLLGRAGNLEEAKLFIRDMPIRPNEVTWTALLGACRTYGDVELGEFAARELFKLEPKEASGYVTLSNIYAAAGKWEKVSMVRTMMQKRGIRKEPGRSWIEVDKKIHEFVVGDKSHPEAKAIYAELNSLTEKLKAEGYIPDVRPVLHDMNEDDKELALCSHSEKLAITYGLMHIPLEEPIRVRKNLRVCPDCHTATKLISKVTGREIIARDAHRFHHFKDGLCSCGDYW